MKLMAVNINPKEHFYSFLGEPPGEQTRANRIVHLVQSENPDVIFFIEQWYPVFRQVKEELEREKYVFYTPDGFDPGFLDSMGIYRSFAGVVAAVRSTSTVKAEDGKNYVEKTAKWLSLEIDAKVYLGVHYPQPGEQWKTFHQAVGTFAESKKPILMMGDFNTPKGSTVEITGYRDVLGAKGPTYAAGTKLDYIFVDGKEREADGDNIIEAKDPRNVNLYFSDHSVTTVNI